MFTSLYFQTSYIISRVAKVPDLIDIRLFLAYELEDDSYAESTRATLSAEFLTLCRSVEWMKEAFSADDTYGRLAEEVSAEKLKSSIDSAMTYRATLNRKSRHAQVRPSLSPLFVYTFVVYTGHFLRIFTF